MPLATGLFKDRTLVARFDQLLNGQRVGSLILRPLPTNHPQADAEPDASVLTDDRVVRVGTDG